MGRRVLGLKTKREDETRAHLFRILEHHDPEKFDVLRCPCPEDIAWRRTGGGEDDESNFPNDHPFDLLASREQPECPSGQKKIFALN
jgi:hypothetical protein